MGGSAVAFVGFPVDMTKVKTYMTNHGLLFEHPLTVDVIKKLLHKLEEEMSTIIHLANIEDSKGEDHYYLCNFVNYQHGWIQDYDDLVRIAIPPKFNAFVQTLGHEGTGMKKMSAAIAKLYSYDASGTTRIKFL